MPILLWSPSAPLTLYCVHTVQSPLPLPLLWPRPQSGDCVAPTLHCIHTFCVPAGTVPHTVRRRLSAVADIDLYIDPVETSPKVWELRSILQKVPVVA
jgi:hypothetical protein